METNKELIGVKIFNPDEKFTKQIKVVLPKHYISKVDMIADKLNTERRYVIWDAISNYIQICQNSLVSQREVFK
jgi:metal-responsive CopG/Arc/MetJ family transcriptional regulator